MCTNLLTALLVHREPNDFTHDEWVQFFEVIEELGGSQGIKAAHQGAADVDTTVPELDTSGKDFTTAAGTLKIRKLGPVYRIHTSNPAGRGAVLGTGLQVQTSQGNMTYNTQTFRRTNRVQVVATNAGLKAKFHEGIEETAAFTGNWSGNTMRAGGIFAFY
jgi:hypothetical protein